MIFGQVLDNRSDNIREESPNTAQAQKAGNGSG